MAKRKDRRFTTVGDTGVTLFIEGRPEPLHLAGSGTYTTDDPAEIAALSGSPEVKEVKIPDRKSDG